MKFWRDVTRSEEHRETNWGFMKRVNGLVSEGHNSNYRSSKTNSIGGRTTGHIWPNDQILQYFSPQYLQRPLMNAVPSVIDGELVFPLLHAVATSPKRSSHIS